MLKTMSKTPKNNMKEWGRPEVQELKHLARENTPTRVIGLKIGRTENAVRAQASKEHISLKPTNQSPYNRKAK
jgi:hypothetical protein